MQYIIGKSRNPMQLYFKQMVLKVRDCPDRSSFWQHESSSHREEIWN